MTYLEEHLLGRPASLLFELRRVSVRLCALCLCLCFSLAVAAQRQRNYIYVFDCTRSMKIGTDIFTPAKAWLREDIERQEPDASITIFPFREKVLDRLTFERASFNWKDVEAKLDKYVSLPGGKTGICHTWDEALGALDPHRDNYFYLLTDGKDELSPIQHLQERIDHWCEQHAACYGFYVMMRPEARQGLRLQACDRFFFIDGTKHLAPFGTFRTTHFSVNLRDLKPKTLSFSTSGTFKAKATTSDPHFYVALRGGQISAGKATFEVKPRGDVKALLASLPATYQIAVHIDTDPARLNLLTSDLTIDIANRRVPNLDIVGEEQEGNAQWYPRFLFWSEAKPDTIAIPLCDVWNDDARASHSRLTLTAEGADGSRLLLNGKPDLTLTAEHAQDTLQIVFAHAASSGKHYLTLHAAGIDLETINDNPSEDYTLTLRLKYHVAWNPLQWILLLLFLSLVAALLLWFVLLKRWCYPTFPIRHIQISEPYYKIVRLKGARGAVFGSKPVRQSALNRLFTGRIVSEVHPAWVDPVVLTPVRAKKGARAKTGGKYTIAPYAMVLQKMHDYTVEHTDTHTRYHISVN